MRLIKPTAAINIMHLFTMFTFISLLATGKLTSKNTWQSFFYIMLAITSVKIFAPFLTLEI